MSKRSTIPMAIGSLLVLSIPLLLILKNKTKGNTTTGKNSINEYERRADSRSLNRPDHLTSHIRKWSKPVVAELNNGGRAEYRRSGTQLATTYFSTSGEIVCELFYKLDNQGRPLKCDIYDESGKKAYKTSFGYSKRPGPTFGKLVQELRYDTREPHYFDELNLDGTHKEKPVHMVIHSYAEDESPQLPVGMNLKEKPEPEAFLSYVDGGIGKISPEIIDKLNHTNPNEKPIEH